MKTWWKRKWLFPKVIKRNVLFNRLTRRWNFVQFWHRLSRPKFKLFFTQWLFFVLKMWQKYKTTMPPISTWLVNTLLIWMVSIAFLILSKSWAPSDTGAPVDWEASAFSSFLSAFLFLFFFFPWLNTNVNYLVGIQSKNHKNIRFTFQTFSQLSLKSSPVKIPIPNAESQTHNFSDSSFWGRELHLAISSTKKPIGNLNVQVKYSR